MTDISRRFRFLPVTVDPSYSGMKMILQRKARCMSRLDKVTMLQGKQCHYIVISLHQRSMQVSLLEHTVIPGSWALFVTWLGLEAMIFRLCQDRRNHDLRARRGPGFTRFGEIVSYLGCSFLPFRFSRSGYERQYP